ncbi:MAG: SusC/RagA family TonB-linked outer membrane protein, partial [Mucilaginibacter sp.]|nr:SusC/RagA family TonB-linked outer membrane protein [Mucilaginibacter sp.]
FNRNKLLSFPNIAQSPYNYLTVGQPLNITRLLQYTGVDPLTGQYTFKDQNNDGRIDRNFDASTDLVLKDLSVRAQGGFGTSLSFKGFQLDAFFDFQHFLAPAAIYSSPPGNIENESVQVLNHWQKPGDQSVFAKYTTLGNASYLNFMYFSDGALSDASYINLQNLSLSYDFSSTTLKKIGLQSCKFYLRGENLFILTKYDGIDPRVPQLGGLPPEKTIVAGIQFVL